MTTPRWLVLAEDGRLYGYITREVLSIDIALRPTESVKLFELIPGGFTIKYGPISIEELRKSLKPVTGEITSELIEEDPTPYCASCNAKKRKDCDCGPIAANN